MPESDVEKLRLSKDIDPRVTHLVIDFSPLWIDGIGSWYLMKPVSLYREIREVHAQRRFSPAIYAFCDYLLTLNRTPHVINERKLEEKLWLDRHRKQGQTNRIRKAMDDAYQTAKQVKLLKGYQHDDFGHGAFGLITLELNPERCRRVKAAKSPSQMSRLEPLSVEVRAPKCRG